MQDRSRSTARRPFRRFAAAGLVGSGIALSLGAPAVASAAILQPSEPPVIEPIVCGSIADPATELLIRPLDPADVDGMARGGWRWIRTCGDDA